MDNKKGMGITEVILILVILIIFTLIFRGELVRVAAWLYREYFMKLR